MIDSFKNFKDIYKSKKKYNLEELKKFVKASLTKEDFLEYIFTYFSKDNLLSEVDFSLFKEKLSENEFQQLHPKYHYQILWDTLEKQGFTAVDASNNIKWLSITVQMIMNDCIESTFLATLKKNGKDEILEAIRNSENGDNEKLLEVARAIKRALYGFPQFRGKKGIYQSHSIAVAWWRTNLATEINKSTQIEKDVLYEYFKNNSSNYDELVMRMTSKLTIVADKNIRDGLFLYIIESTLTSTKDFKKIIETIGIESTWRAMGSLTADENKEIIGTLAA